MLRISVVMRKVMSSSCADNSSSLVCANASSCASSGESVNGDMELSKDDNSLDISVRSDSVTVEGIDDTKTVLSLDWLRLWYLRARDEFDDVLSIKESSSNPRSSRDADPDGATLAYNKNKNFCSLAVGSR